MSWTLAVAGAGWLVAGAILVVLSTRHRSAELRRTVELRQTIEPYLFRRASELGLDEPPIPASDRHAERVHRRLCELGQRLTAHERQQLGVADTLNIPGHKLPENPKR